MSIQELESIARSARIYYEQNLLIWLDRLHSALQEKSNPIETAISAVNSVLAFYVLLPERMRIMVDTKLKMSVEKYLEYIDIFIGDSRLVFFPETWRDVSKAMESADMTPSEIINISLKDSYELRRRAFKVAKTIIDVLESMGLLLWRRDIVQETV